jgi:hypothetical protein
MEKLPDKPAGCAIDDLIDAEGITLRWPVGSRLGRYVLIAFLSIWLCGWTVGLVFTVKKLILGAPQVLLMTWLAGWTIAGGLVIFILRRVLPRDRPESVRLDAQALRHIPGRSDQINRFTPRLRSLDVQRSKIRGFVLERVDGRQHLRFNHGAEHVEIGSSLREPEREWLYAVLQRWYSADEPLQLQERDRVELLRFGPDSITIQGRPIEVPETPNSSGEIVARPPMRSRLAGDRLIVAMWPGWWLIGGALFLAGLVPAAAAVLAVIRDWGDPSTTFLIFLGVGVPIAGGYCLITGMLSVRYELDRAQGVYRRRTILRSSERPLSDLVAVQANRGPMRKNRSEGGPPVVQTYELNLIIYDGAVHRETISHEDRPRWIVELGETVSDFLRVPFFCRV